MFGGQFIIVNGSIHIYTSVRSDNTDNTSIIYIHLAVDSIWDFQIYTRMTIDQQPRINSHWRNILIYKVVPPS